MMTKKDYEAIEEQMIAFRLISYNCDFEEAQTIIVNNLADYFKSQDANFDKRAFKRKCLK